MVTVLMGEPGFALAYTSAEWNIGQVYAEEAELVQGSVASRRAEFLTVRHCAREALQVLGYCPTVILPSPDRAPQWPVGICGSLTHCVGMRAALVAQSNYTRAVGLDAEPWEVLPDGVLELIANNDERRSLRREFLSGVGGRLVFSAKESSFKAMYSLGLKVAEPHDLTVQFEPAAIDFGNPLLEEVQGSFVVRRRRPDIQVRGVWRRIANSIVTLVHVPAGESLEGAETSS